MACGHSTPAVTTSWCSIPDAGVARLLLRRAHVWTPSRPDATAVLLDGDRVAWIGDEDGVAGLYALGSLAGVAEVDCAGGLITPSFVDSHVHLFATGLTLPGVDGTAALAGVGSAGELLAAVATAAATLPPTAPVLGFGWDESGWPAPDLPDPGALRRAAGGREVFLGRVDMHSALVAADGVPGPSGEAALLAWEGTGPAGAVFARLSAEPSLRRRLIAAALGRAAAEGIGCVHEMAAPHLNPVSDLDLLAAFDADPVYPRVLRWWGEHVDSGGVARAQAAGALGCGGDLCIDGSIGSRTAALLLPYADAPAPTGSAPTRGRLQLDPPSIARHVRSCVENRIGTGFHVIGDAAATALAEGLQEAAQNFGGRLPIPVRMEHAELIPEHLLPVLAGLGVLAGVQPGFQTRWGGPGELYEQRLGIARATRMNRFADLAAAGIPLAFGSDSPVLPLSGWAMVRAAAFHPDPAQRLTARAAFAAATRGGWRAAGSPERGVLVPGAVADLALWDVPGELGIQTPDARVAAWSTDPRARLPALPVLGATAALPTCRLLLVGGTVVHEARAA
jgi:predicted amidohydrolase YtcJ